MFLLAHVNFFALKLSRIKSAGEGGGQRDGGGAPLSSVYSLMWPSLSVVSQTIYPADVRVVRPPSVGTQAPPHSNHMYRRATDLMRKQHEVLKEGVGPPRAARTAWLHFGKVLQRSVSKTVYFDIVLVSAYFLLWAGVILLIVPWKVRSEKQHLGANLSFKFCTWTLKLLVQLSLFSLMYFDS